MFENLLTENIKRLVFDSPEGENPKETNGKIRFDATGNPFGSPLEQDFHHHSDAPERELKERLRLIKSTEIEKIFVGNGIEEAIELLLRLFCEPNEDNLIICTPTNPKYEIAAKINHVKVKKVALDDNFQLDIEQIAATIDNFTKIIFLCSPNEATSNALHFQDIEIILNNFDGIVVLDETYINYSRQRSFLSSLKDYPNLVILQTLSQAWGLAGLPLGMAFADSGIIEVMRHVKFTPTLSHPTKNLIINALDNIDLVNQWTKDTVALRQYFTKELEKNAWIERVLPSDTNFIIIKTKPNAQDIYQYFLKNDIVLYPSFEEKGLENCLRIAVRTLEDIKLFLKISKKYDF
jgi:histidinol-phosphate aminotransferase